MEGEVITVNTCRWRGRGASSKALRNNERACVCVLVRSGVLAGLEMETDRDRKRERKSKKDTERETKRDNEKA